MIPRTATATILLLLLSAPAKADKFHFGKADEAAKTEGNAGGRVIEGVLLKQDEKTYTIRIVGGEMVIARSMVARIEKDALTVQMIETMETDQRDQLAREDTKRRQVQAAEATARRAATEKAATGQASAEKSMVIEVDFQNLLPGYTFRTFDPVLNRANLTGLRQVIEDFLRQEVKRAAHRSK